MYAEEKPVIALEAPYVETVVYNEPIVEVPEVVSKEEKCNCYLYLKNRIDNLPRMADVNPNSEITVGSVAVFMYPNGVKHVALVDQIWDGEFVVTETNYKNCKYGKRIVKDGDKSLLGFWKK